MASKFSEIADGSMEAGLYRYHVIDPMAKLRPGPDWLGVEMTIPKLARECGLGNIDPQHISADTPAEMSAISASLDWPLPPDGATLATLRPDADALGAMAVLTLRRAGTEFNEEQLGRIALIDRLDRFAHGRWPGASLEAGEIVGSLTRDTDRQFAALSWLTRRRNIPVRDRVRTVCAWLQDGSLDGRLCRAAALRQRALVASLHKGATRVVPDVTGRIARVISAEASALGLGYALAPVVLALHPTARFGRARGPKFTLAQFGHGHVDMARFLSLVNDLEPGWGGSATIAGSPQDRSSSLDLERVAGIVSSVLV